METIIHTAAKLKEIIDVENVPSQRISLDEYFMTIALATAKRSTCPRLSVGAVLTKDGKILSTGYNGSPRGTAHCSEVGCYMVNGSCKRTTHAEANALLFAKGNFDGGTLYCTSEPCLECTKIIINSGVIRVVYRFQYKNADPLSKELFEESGVVHEHLHLPLLQN
jgi:dCMP deaminase